jgi:serine/threonine-protein kinase
MQAMSQVESDSPEDTLAWLAKVNASSAGELAGKTLGDFAIERLLGRGGMGEVYLARQLSLSRPVALKILRTDLLSRESYLSRFQTEATAVAKLNHPNIVHVYTLGHIEPHRFIAMEYVEGTNLREYIRKKGALDLPLAYSIMRQSCQAIQAAGEVGLVHRDVKPENILVTRRGKVKVADFGLCRDEASEGVGVTQSGVTMGTPLYMSPEQAQGHAIDHRSDLYSLGVTFYHMLSGEPPFRGDSAISLALKHVREMPRSLLIHRPDLPIEVDRLVMKLMSKSPEDRYQSAAEVLGGSSTTTGAITEVRSAVATREEPAAAARASHTPTPWPTVEPWGSAAPGPEWGVAPAPALLVAPKPDAPVIRALPRPADREAVPPPRFRWLVAILIGTVSLVAGAVLGWKGRAPELATLPSPPGGIMPVLWAVPQWESIPRQKSPEEQFRYAAFLAPRDEWAAAWAAVPGYFRNSHEPVSRAYTQLARIWFRQDNIEMLELLATELAAWKEKQARDEELVEVIQLALKVRKHDYEAAAERARLMALKEIGKIWDPTLLQLSLEINVDAMNAMAKNAIKIPPDPFFRSQRQLYRQLFRVEWLANPGNAGKAG